MSKICGNCIHYDVCMDYTTLKESEFAQNFKGSDILCEHFKPKSRYIELPCAVGDTVYEPQTLRNRIQAYNITTSKWNGHYWWFSWILKERKGIFTNVEGFSSLQIGKTVFLSKEEAEQKLKEKENV